MNRQSSTIFMKLRRLTASSERGDLDSTFQKARDALENAEVRGVVQIRIATRERNLYWCFDLTAGGCGICRERVDRPDLELVMREATWWEIADGIYSPLEAFRDGKLKVRGDIDFGKGILSHLASSQGEMDICEM